MASSKEGHVKHDQNVLYFVNCRLEQQRSSQHIGISNLTNKEIRSVNLAL